MSDTRIARYEAWIQELERRQEDIARKQPGYIRFFVAIPLTSILGFIWGSRIGIGALLTGILMCAFGCYTVLFRAGEYERELVGLRRVAEDLRADAPPTQARGSAAD